MRYFAKELPEQAISIMGHPYRFDFLATENPVLVAELEKCVRKQRGGVSEISKEAYDEGLKKKATETLLLNSSRPHPQRHELKASNNLPHPDRRVAEVVANPGGRRNGMFARPQVDRNGAVLNGRRPDEPMPDPIQIPNPAQFATPPTAKMSAIK